MPRKRNREQQRLRSRRQRAKWRANDPSGYARKRREALAAYRASHPEAVKRQRGRSNAKWRLVIRRYGADRRAWVKAARIWWVITHPAEVAKWAAERDRKLRHQKMVARQNRRAKERGGKLSLGLQGRLWALQRGRCAVCRGRMTSFHLDHVIPLALGGPNVDQNIQLLCPPCNIRKRDIHPVEFMQRVGYLL